MVTGRETGWRERGIFIRCGCGEKKTLVVNPRPVNFFPSNEGSCEKRKLTSTWTGAHNPGVMKTGSNSFFTELFPYLSFFVVVCVVFRDLCRSGYALWTEFREFFSTPLPPPPAPSLLIADFYYVGHWKPKMKKRTQPMSSHLGRKNA